jgi:hypothetical protein
MTTKSTPKQAPKQGRPIKPFAFSPFEIEQHAQANKAMSTIHSPC